MDRPYQNEAGPRYLPSAVQKRLALEGTGLGSNARPGVGWRGGPQRIGGAQFQIEVL